MTATAVPAAAVAAAAAPDYHKCGSPPHGDDPPTLEQVMNEKTFTTSPGLELVVVDERRIAVSLYGRRFTISDETGVVRDILVGAAQPRPAVELLDNARSRGVPAEDAARALEALSSAKFIEEAPQGGLPVNVVRHANSGLAMDPALLESRACQLVVMSQ